MSLALHQGMSNRVQRSERRRAALIPSILLMIGSCPASVGAGPTLVNAPLSETREVLGWVLGPVRTELETLLVRDQGLPLVEARSYWVGRSEPEAGRTETARMLELSSRPPECDAEVISFPEETQRGWRAHPASWLVEGPFVRRTVHTQPTPPPAPPEPLSLVEVPLGDSPSLGSMLCVWPSELQIRAAPQACFRTREAFERYRVHRQERYLALLDRWERAQRCQVRWFSMRSTSPCSWFCFQSHFPPQSEPDNR